jgi:hypothetical protein
MASSEGIAEILKQEHEAHNRGKCRGKDFCDFCIVEAEARASVFTDETVEKIAEYLYDEKATETTWQKMKENLPYCENEVNKKQTNVRQSDIDKMKFRFNKYRQKARSLLQSCGFRECSCIPVPPNRSGDLKVKSEEEVRKDERNSTDRADFIALPLSSKQLPVLTEQAKQEAIASWLESEGAAAILANNSIFTEDEARQTLKIISNKLKERAAKLREKEK